MGLTVAALIYLFIVTVFYLFNSYCKCHQINKILPACRGEKRREPISDVSVCSLFRGCQRPKSARRARERIIGGERKGKGKDTSHMAAPPARGRADYDYLIKLLLIGDSG